MGNSVLFQELVLPCGAVIKNRFFKAAMSETFANRKGQPNKLHINLYKHWAEGGAGLVLTGNIMIDPNAKGEPGNVVIEDERDIDVLREWAKAGTANGTHLWVQLNHPGKQSPKTLSKKPVAPSAVPIGGNYKAAFNPPRELSHSDIKEIVQRFVNAAVVSKKAGFTGVEIHAAHGYLVNQFLSPSDNIRQDEYGGSLENRMRFLVEIYKGMRSALGNNFPIGIKLNSTDFKDGGFSESDSIEVIKKMAELGIDLIEISGGSYENPKMADINEIEGEKPFFIEYAQKLQSIVNIPIVVTGGFRSEKSMTEAIEKNITAMVGIGRPFALMPDLPNQIYNGTYKAIKTKRLTTGFAFLDKKIGATIGNTYYEQQMNHIAKGLQPNIHGNGWIPLLHSLKVHGIEAFMPIRS